MPFSQLLSLKLTDLITLSKYVHVLYYKFIPNLNLIQKYLDVKANMEIMKIFNIENKTYRMR